jgi:hypothetical protein
MRTLKRSEVGAGYVFPATLGKKSMVIAGDQFDPVLQPHAEGALDA